MESSIHTVNIATKKTIPVDTSITTPHAGMLLTLSP